MRKIANDSTILATRFLQPVPFINAQRFAYTQHAQKCLKNVEVEVEDDDDNNDSEKYSSKMDTRSDLSSEYENDKVEVDDDNNVQNMSFDSIGSAISVMSLENKFPNDAYKDLMLLNLCIKNILTVPDITQNFALSYENYEYNRENATTTDTLGKSQLHPIYISLGNNPIWRRNKQDAKQLLGYLPILEAANKDLIRNTFHKSLRHLLEPIILLKNGIDLFINNENTWFYPRVSTIIADWPEAASFCLVYKSSNSSLPCHSCLIKRDNLANINLSVNDVILRTHDEMRKYFENDTQKSVCIEFVPNFFWDLPNINIYLATVPDRMHHLDLGLFRYQIIFTCDILKLQHVNGNKLVEEVDRCLAAIPRFPAIKIFSNGLQSIARLTANEYRSLMKVMIFVIDNLYDENNNEVDNFVNNNDLAKLYEYWNEMYILSRYEEFSESDLEKFNDAIHRWARIFVKAFKFVSPSNLKLPKLHS
ncbi:hypothetical protein GLOIN_2v1488317 [Rhizophagus irregularis DAOM 181602=DAOM 197198]|nr:hypothetical protein GLOIN_2v1488317 [Rhizophagus irregularis DAOM 181602=DAOM 197198]